VKTFLPRGLSGQEEQFQSIELGLAYFRVNNNIFFTSRPAGPKIALHFPHLLVHMLRDSSKDLM